MDTILKLVMILLVKLIFSNAKKLIEFSQKQRQHIVWWLCFRYLIIALQGIFALFLLVIAVCSSNLVWWNYQQGEAIFGLVMISLLLWGLALLWIYKCYRLIVIVKLK